MQRRTKFILFFVYILFFVILGALIALFGTPMCLRRECEKKAEYIILRMDRDADPCEDFHRFVCGKGAHNVTLANKNSSQAGSSATLFKMMSDKVEDYVNRLQSALDAVPEPIYHESLYYHLTTTCSEMESGANVEMTVEYVNQALGFSLYETGMSIYDMFNTKKFNESLTIGIYEYKSRVTGFKGRRIFDSDFKPDHRNPTSKAFYIQKPDKYINLAMYVTQSSSAASWATVMISVVKTFILNADKENFPSVETFTDVAKLMIEIDKIRLETNNGKNKNLRPIDLKEFESYPDLDLKGYLRQVVGDDKKLPTHLYIDLDSLDYFQKLKNVLKKYSKYVKILYIVIQNLFDFAAFIRLDSDVEQVAGSPEKSNICVTLMNTNIAAILSSLIIERFKIKKSGALLLGDMFTNLKTVLETSMKKSTWMDKPTKTKGILKLHSMLSEISLSDSDFNSIKSPGRRRHYYDGLCLRNSFIENVLCVQDFFTKKQFSLSRRDISGFDSASDVVFNVKYKREKNTLYVPFNILRLPAYEDNWPTNVNFGGMAAEIATEMIGGFDYDGSKFGRFGSDDQWWTSATNKTFNNMYSSCSKFYESEEGFADINRDFTIATGLRLAYKAYVEYKKKNTNKEQLLPGLEMYSPKQVLFLSHAHMHCESPGDTEEKKASVKNYFKFISSSDEFSDTFGCKGKARMGSAKAINKCMLL